MLEGLILQAQADFGLDQGFERCRVVRVLQQLREPSQELKRLVLFTQVVVEHARAAQLELQNFAVARVLRFPGELLGGSLRLVGQIECLAILQLRAEQLKGGGGLLALRQQGESLLRPIVQKEGLEREPQFRILLDPVRHELADVGESLLEVLRLAGESLVGRLQAKGFNPRLPHRPGWPPREFLPIALLEQDSCNQIGLAGLLRGEPGFLEIAFGTVEVSHYFVLRACLGLRQALHASRFDGFPQLLSFLIDAAAQQPVGRVIGQSHLALAGHAHLQQVLQCVELAFQQDGRDGPRRLVGDLLHEEVAGLGVVLRRGELQQDGAAGAALLEQRVDDHLPGGGLAGPVLLDQFQDLFGRVRVDAPFELVEKLPRPAHDLGVGALDRLLQGRLGRPARFPEGFRRLLADGEAVVAELLDLAGDFLLAGTGWGGCRHERRGRHDPDGGKGKHLHAASRHGGLLRTGKRIVAWRRQRRQG